MKAMETSPGGVRAVRPRIGMSFRVGRLTVESPTERRKGIRASRSPAAERNEEIG